VPDPGIAGGAEAERWLAFADAYRMLNNRISISSVCRSHPSTASRYRSGRSSATTCCHFRERGDARFDIAHPFELDGSRSSPNDRLAASGYSDI
jgi:hypothetical protein